MTTTAGRALTDAHRQAQARLRNRMLLGLRPLWPLLEWPGLDQSFPTWFRAVAPIVLDHRLDSVAVAATYLRGFREAEEVPGRLHVVPAPELELQTLEMVLRLSSVVAARTFARAGGLTGGLVDQVMPSRRITAAQAMKRAEVRAIGAAGRLVLAGGRETVTETALQDDEVVGVARATDGSPCAFCAMLATRGPVYKRRTVGGSDRAFVGTRSRIKVHDHCGCQPEEVFRRSAWTPPPVVAANQDLYKAALAFGGDAEERLRDFEALYRERATGRPSRRLQAKRDAASGQSKASTPSPVRDVDAGRSTEQLRQTLGSLERSLEKFDSPATRARVEHLRRKLAGRS